MKITAGLFLAGKSRLLPDVKILIFLLEYFIVFQRKHRFVYKMQGYLL